MVQTVNTLGDVDRRIVAMLQRDGRVSISEVAAQVGISRAAASRRVRALRERGIVDVVAATDPLQLGFSVRMLGLRVEGGSADAAARLAELPEVTYCVIGAGSYDVLVELVCRDADHLLETLALVSVIEGIRVEAGFEYLRLVKQSYGWGASEDG